MSADLLSTFKARYAFPLDDFQLRAIRAIRRRTVGDRLRAHRRGQDPRRRVRHPRARSPRAPHRLHHAAQGAVQPEVRRLLPAVRRGSGRHPDRRRQGQPARARAGDDHRDPAQHVLHAAASTASATSCSTSATTWATRAAGTVWEEIIVNAPKDVALVALSATVANVEEIADWISARAPAHRGHRPSAPAGAAATTWSPTCPARSTRWTPCAAAGAPARRGARRRPRRPRALVHAARGRPHR